MLFSKAIQSLSLILVFTASASFSKADEYQFSVSAPQEQFGDLGHVKNCLDYSFCEATRGLVGGGENSTRFHTFIHLTSPEKLNKAINRCSKNDFNSIVAIKNVTKNIAVETIIFEPNPLPFTAELPHIYLKKLSVDEQRVFIDELKKDLKEKKYAEAIALVVSTYQLPTEGYIITMDEKKAPDSCVTDHKLKQINMGLDFAENHCTFALAIRHELEHVQQVKKADECLDDEMIHDFTEHNSRERSAYLNDFYNADVICDDKNTALDLKYNAVENFLRYLKK